MAFHFYPLDLDIHVSVSLDKNGFEIYFCWSHDINQNGRQDVARYRGNYIVTQRSRLRRPISKTSNDI